MERSPENPQDKEAFDQKTSLESLDIKWYGRFAEVGSFEPEEYFHGDKGFREEQEVKFLSGEIKNPILDLPNLDADKIDDFDQRLRQLKKEIIDQEEDELVKQVYHWKINEKLAQLGIMKAAKEGNMRHFERYNRFVYGDPDEELFTYTVDGLRKQAEQALESDNTDLQEAAKDVLDSFPEVSKRKSLLLPSEETVKYARGVTEKELTGILEIEEFEGKIDAQAIKQIFDGILNKMNLSREKGGNWKVIVDHISSKTDISVNQEEMQVKIPASREITLEKLKGLIAHELGTHVRRRISGERSILKLLGLGLDRNLLGEEGVATMRQKVIEEEEITEFAGLRYHLGIALARGLDGQPKDFRETYELLKKRDFFQNLLKEKSVEKAEELSSQRAYRDCVRIFKGTDCKTPGTCFSRDIVYREGNIGIFLLISTEKGKQEMLRFSIGKYDPTNERHLWVLDQLGITDKDLVDLERQ